MPITQREISVLQNSFPTDREQLNRVATVFYEKLFKAAPELEVLFPTQIEEQHRKLLSALNVVLNGISDLETLTPMMKSLGEKHHHQYGVRPQHYVIFGKVMVETLEQELSEQWSESTTAVWNKFYTAVAGTMQIEPDN